MKQEIDTLLNLAYIYMNYGKTKRAIDYLLIAYRIAPDNIQVKKMKVAAFRDIGAFSQALDIIDDLETRYKLEKNDAITLKLMKSFCLQGLNRLDEGKKIFAEYVSERKEFATKEFMKKYRRSLAERVNINNTHETDYSSGSIDTQHDIQHFVQQNYKNQQGNSFRLA